MASEYYDSRPMPRTWLSYLDRKKRTVKRTDSEVLVHTSIDLEN